MDNQDDLQETSLEEIQLKINDVEKILNNNKVSFVRVSAEDLSDYFSYEAPTGDVTTLEDVISNKLLLIHELLEISELKKHGLPLTISVFRDNYPDLLEAHVFATEKELFLANKTSDKYWVTNRITIVKSWLDDTEIPTNIRKRYLSIIEKYT